MKRWLISLSLAALLASNAFALPTVNDVQSEVRKGNYTQAQTMMREVVEAKPGSAKAHYIYAEILAHNARFADAAEQVRISKQIDPAGKFSDPDKIRSFEQLLDREQARTSTRATTPTPAIGQQRQNAPITAPAAMAEQAPVMAGNGIPVWVWLGVAAVAFFAWRMMRARPGPVARGPAGAAFGPVGGPAPYGPGASPATGYGPGYGGSGFVQQPGRGGSGLLGTGLAAAGGVAAGMMAEKWLEGNHGNGSGSGSGNPAFDNAGGSGGGNAFTAPERDEAARDLENRDVDFGTGNDWDDGAGASDAGSFDSGSGGGSDDW